MNTVKTESKWLQRLTTSRILLFLIGLVPIGLLAVWTVGVLWGHIDGLNSPYSWAMKAGVLATETTILIFLFLHIFHPRARIRLYALAMGVFLSVVAVVHNAGVMKYDAAHREGSQTISLLGEAMRKNNEAGTAAIIGASGEQAAQLRQRRAPNSANRLLQSGQSQAASVIAESNKTLADTALKTGEQAKQSTFLPASYMNGAMYAVLFILSLLTLGGLFWMIEAAEGYADLNGNGIPDKAEYGHPSYDPEYAARYWRERGYYAPHESQQPPQRRIDPLPRLPQSVTAQDDRDPKA